MFIIELQPLLVPGIKTMYNAAKPYETAEKEHRNYVALRQMIYDPITAPARRVPWLLRRPSRQ